MTYSNEHELTRLWLPLARAIQPADQMARAKAVGRAITDDGYIDPIAVLPGSTVMVDFSTSSLTGSSSDTVNYAAYMTTTIHLTDGTWRLKARGALSGSLSGASTLNCQLVLNGSASGNYAIPLGAGDMGVTFANHELPEVSGDVLLQLMYRPSGGTATIEAGEWLYRAERIR